MSGTFLFLPSRPRNIDKCTPKSKKNCRINRRGSATHSLTAEFLETMIREDEKFPFNLVLLAMYFQQRLASDGDAELMQDKETVIENTYVETNDSKPEVKK
ncbi:hypothetical protein OXYTRIMIC_574 [Oxytricha trifallax]|uniref:Uncharacterized protein n=1 Tax=Oxytricha trifallax TaxID=1172189 RepID=A0A073I0Q5_9SPIT|nr:hypothetical protein OXYTRIMIC_574 [Oxytricha trifallax]